MALLPQVTDHEDPGNKLLATLAAIAVPLFLALTVFVQQFMLAQHDLTLDEAPTELVENETVNTPGIESFTLEIKAMLKEAYFMENPTLFDEDAEGLIIDEVPILEALDEMAA